MATTVLGATMSPDGFIADDHDGVGPLFDWYGNGDVDRCFAGNNHQFRSSEASAEFMRDAYAHVAVAVIGRRVFDLTNGWDGRPAAGEHVFVVTHEPPTGWEYADIAPFTFVGSAESAIERARELAGDRLVDVRAGQIGGQALRLGLIDQAIINLVPIVVFGSGRPFFPMRPLGEPILLDNPTRVVLGDRVTHLVYDVARQVPA